MRDTHIDWSKTTDPANFDIWHRYGRSRISKTMQTVCGLPLKPSLRLGELPLLDVVFSTICPYCLAGRVR